MADIEKMYFQIFVAKQHRKLLQFLWWKEGNISNKPADYEMCDQQPRPENDSRCQQREIW